MTVRKTILWALFIAIFLYLFVFGVSLTKGPSHVDDIITIPSSNSPECSDRLTGVDGTTITLECVSPSDCGPGQQCGPDIPVPPITTDGGCVKLGVSGACLDRALFSDLERADYAFNAPQVMMVSEPQTIALVIDTTGQTNFSAELMALPGAPVQGETPISLIMEAEIIGPAFEITPKGRQRRELSKLNPTRWDWEVLPKRGGRHQLEVSLYVIATSAGKNLGEEKALAERQVINVTVSRLDRLISFAEKADPLWALIFALAAGITSLLAWFGIKSWKDVYGRKPEEVEPQKIEVTIKNGRQQPQGDEDDKA